MNSSQASGPGGGGWTEFLLYLLPVAAVALMLFVGVKYFQKGEQASPERVVNGSRRAQRKVSGKLRAWGASRRGERPHGLIIKEPPPPGAPSVAGSAKRIETASASIVSTRRAGTPHAGGAAFQAWAPGDTASSSVSTGEARRSPRSALRAGGGGEKKSPDPSRRREEGGRSAFAGTVVVGGRYGAGAATLPGSGKREAARRARRLSTNGSGGTSGALSAAKRLSVNEALEGGSIEAPGDPVTNAVLGQIDVEHSMIKGLREKAEEIRAAGRPATRGELREEAAAMMGSRGLEEGDVDPGELVERSLAPGPLVDVEVKKERTRDILSNPATIPTESEEKAILERVENPPPKPSGPPPKGVVDAYHGHRATFERVEEQFGVKPEDILAILWTETRLGRVTGEHPLMKTLRTFAKGPAKHWRTKQAKRDLAVVGEVEDKGIIENPAALDCSWATACGPPQCMMSSCNAYWPSGGKPLSDFDASIEFIAKYLKAHGYDKSVAKSFYGYNHSQEYVAKVTAASNRIEAALKKKP